MSTRRSLVFSFIDRYASLAIGVVSSMIIARLLTPADIGIFSVAMVLIGLVSTVRDMGAGQYLLQEKELTQDRIRAVWAVQLGLGILLAVVVLGLSIPAAHFYAERRVAAIMQLLALNYLVNPLGSVTYAWLMREMRYDAVAIMRCSGALGGSIVSVSLAILGHGPISLAWGSLASTLCNAGASLFFRPRNYPWIPGTREIRRVLSFGSKITSGSIASSVAAGAPEFLLGKVQGLAAAGLFSRAQGLVAMFDRLVSDAVYPVALSLFSKELREPRGGSPSFIKSISYITALSWAFAIATIFLAHPLVRVLYGNQWDQSVNLARLLAAAMAFAAPVPICHAALVAGGAATRLLKATSMAVALSLPLVAAGVVAGLQYVGVAIICSAIVSAAIWLFSARAIVDFDWSELGAELGKSLMVAAASGIAPGCAFLAWRSDPEQLLLPLITGAIGAGIGLVLAIFAVKHPLKVELRRMAPALFEVA